MKKCILLMLYSLLSAGQLWAMELGARASRADLSAVVEVLEDPSGSLSVNDLRRADVAARFRPWSYPGSDVHFGFTASTYWLRMPLARAPDAPANWMLEIPYLHIDRLELHAPDRPPVVTGSERSLASRPYFHRFFVFPITPGPESRYYYVRASSRYALTVPLVAWQAEAFNADTQRTYIVQALYYGGVLALLLYNIFLFVSLGDLRFLLYSLFAAHFGLGMLAGNGLGRLLLWPERPDFDGIAESALLSLAAMFGVLFTRNFLHTRVRSPRLDRLLLLGAAIFLTVSALLFVSLHWPVPTREVIQTLMFTALPTGVLMLVAGLKEWRAGNKGARFFALAWGCLWLGAGIASLRAFGLLPTNGLIAYALQISSAAEMLLLSLALADTIQVERDERARAQSVALEVLRSSEERLEQAVRERTGMLERTLEEQRRLHEQYVRFGSLISHEFRNALGIVGSQLSLLRKEHERGVPQIERRVDIMAGATRRLASLFDKWLRSDRLDESLQQARPGPIDVEAWLRQLLGASGHLLESHSIELRIAPERNCMVADEHLLEIAVGNLIENACKYAEPGTKIVLETHEKPGFAGISVTDAGRGIAPEHHSRIFDEYFRVAPEGAVRGLGLGLPLVRRIVLAHDGHLTLESALGQGSSFCLWLPHSN